MTNETHSKKGTVRLKEDMGEKMQLASSKNKRGGIKRAQTQKIRDHHPAATH